MKYVFIAIAATSLIACGSDDDQATETGSASHDAHTAGATVSIAPLPEVPADAKLFFVNLQDGQTVTSPLKIEMGVEAMAVDTANGKIKTASGHHHILVDVDSIPSGTIVPPTDSLHHYHFGKAQTSGEIKLTPGKHTIALQFADAMHRSYGSRLNTKITVEVKQ
jgi:hypothetical protein